MDKLDFFPDGRYKDASPMDTVNRIKQILKEHGIETEETWRDSKVPNCYSLWISIAGTAFGSAGKGISREFALASGYGELMERLQVGHIWRDKLSVEGGTASCEAQSVPVNGEELLERNAKWYDIYSDILKRSTGISMSGREILEQLVQEDGSVPATAFYCLTGDTREYLPAAFVKSLYLTSGGAAGNTIEEAMVQAIGEVVERYYKLRILAEEIPVPEVPEDVLQACPVSYKIIQFLRDNGYRVIVRDCSLGGKFPVLCVCLINTNTGKYHTHFGAHPKFDIALERTLTESFQGRSIRNVAKHEDFSFQKTGFYDHNHRSTELVYGTSEKYPRFFLRETQNPFNRKAGFSGTTNKELLKECVDFFREQGYDILVRDCSCLGFPTCQVIIPGYSEVFPHRVCVKSNDMLYSRYAIKTLQDPARASLEDILGLMMHMKERSHTSVKAFTFESGIPANLPPEEEAFLMNASMAHISYTLGRHKDTLNYISSMLRDSHCRDAEYLLCVKRQISMVKNGYSPEETRKILEALHSPESVDRLFACLEEKRNPLDPVVLHCDMQCTADCRLLAQCGKKRTDQLIRLIRDKSAALDQTPMIEHLRKLCFY